MKRECESCIKRKTPYCPTSIECMATDDMPYYQNRIMLLEENKKQKEVINNAIEYIKEKQKIQYKFALSHIECDDLLEILEDKEVSE